MSSPAWVRVAEGPTYGELCLETLVCDAGVGPEAEQHGSSCRTLSRRLRAAAQAGNDSSADGGAISQLQVVMDTAGPDKHRLPAGHHLNRSFRPET